MSQMKRFLVTCVMLENKIFRDMRGMVTEDTLLDSGLYAIRRAEDQLGLSVPDAAAETSGMENW